MTLPPVGITLALTLAAKVTYTVIFMDGVSALTVDQALDELGWSQAELSRRLGVHENTVIQWKALGMPEYAQAYLRLAIDVRALADGLGPQPRTRRK